MQYVRHIGCLTKATAGGNEVRLNRLRLTVGHPVLSIISGQTAVVFNGVH